MVSHQRNPKLQKTTAETTDGNKLKIIDFTYETCSIRMAVGEKEPGYGK